MILGQIFNNSIDCPSGINFTDRLPRSVLAMTIKKDNAPLAVIELINKEENFKFTD